MLAGLPPPRPLPPPHPPHTHPTHSHSRPLGASHSRPPRNTHTQPQTPLLFSPPTAQGASVGAAASPRGRRGPCTAAALHVSHSYGGGVTCAAHHPTLLTHPAAGRAREEGRRTHGRNGGWLHPWPPAGCGHVCGGVQGNEGQGAALVCVPMGDGFGGFSVEISLAPLLAWPPPDVGQHCACSLCRMGWRWP